MNKILEQIALNDAEQNEPRATVRSKDGSSFAA
jgi:hypothetical protein